MGNWIMPRDIMVRQIILDMARGAEEIAAQREEGSGEGCA
jgi:hypothetical protein